MIQIVTLLAGLSLLLPTGSAPVAAPVTGTATVTAAVGAPVTVPFGASVGVTVTGGTTGAASATGDRNAARYDLGEGRLALKGYDPLAYWEQGGSSPTPGKASLSLEHQGVVYRFASEAHRELFLSDPARFEPAYGGWCAFAMSRDKRKELDPHAFRVSQGRLFVFSDTDYMDVDDDWVEQEPTNIERADRNWQAYSGEAPRRAPQDSWRPYREFNLSDDSLALEGYDPVSYFPESGGKPRKGSKQIRVRYQGVLYRFATQEHRKLFLANPAHYEPAHGGWCSYAMGDSGERVEVDPEAFRLTDGRLHLFYNSWLTDTRDPWDADTARLKRQADANWKRQLEAAKAPPRPRR